MNTTHKKLLIVGATVLGIIFIIIACMYWFVAAGALPVFFPGYEAGVTTIHFKHGVASFILGLALFAFVWFNTDKTAKSL